MDLVVFLDSSLDHLLFLLDAGETSHLSANAIPTATPAKEICRRGDHQRGIRRTADQTPAGRKNPIGYRPALNQPCAGCFTLFAFSAERVAHLTRNPMDGGGTRCTRLDGSVSGGVILSIAVAFEICSFANPELIDSDAARKCTAYTYAFQEEAAVNPVNCEQNICSTSSKTPIATPSHERGLALCPLRVLEQFGSDG